MPWPALIDADGGPVRNRTGIAGLGNRCSILLSYGAQATEEPTPSFNHSSVGESETTGMLFSVSQDATALLGRVSGNY